MNDRKIMQQITTVFAVFMVFFYLGVGIFLIWYADLSTIDKAVRVLLGSAFMLLGVFRAFRAWEKIKEVFFTKNNEYNGDKAKGRRSSF